MLFCLSSSSYSVDWNGGPVSLKVCAERKNVAHCVSCGLRWWSSWANYIWPRGVSIQHNEEVVGMIRGKFYIYELDL